MRHPRRTLTILALTGVAGVFALSRLVGPHDEAPPPSPVYAAQPLTLPAPELSVPMLPGSDYVMLEVRVNGRGPYAFWMDTGASVQACVDQRLARELGLEIVGSVQNGDASGRSQERPLAAIGSLRLGEVLFEDLEAIVADYSWVDHGDIDALGILGMNLFADRLVTLDYPRRRFELRRGELPAPGDNHVAAYRTDEGTPQVEMLLGDRRLTVHLDSGYRGVLILPHDLLEPVGIDGLRTGGKGTGVNGTFRTVNGILARPVSFAGWTWRGVPGVFAEGFDYGLAGRGLLLHHAVTIDPRNRRVHVGAADA